MNSCFLWQNTNGVNFYNILTQDPEEKLGEELRISTENFIGKTRYQWSQSPVSSWLDPEACPYTWCSMLFLFYPCTALQIHRHIRPLHRQSLSQLMNGPVREKLGIIPKNVTWGGAAFFNTHGPERIFAIIKNHFCLILFSLCVQARRRKCSATWREISWDLWWMWSTSCWAPESTSPSTTGSWIS